MMNRSNSVPPNSRSMLQQQLMDMGGTYTTPRPSPNPPALTPPTRQKQSSPFVVRHGNTPHRRCGVKACCCCCCCRLHFRVVLFLSRF